MNLSRTESRRRLSAATWVRWLLLAGLLLVLALALLVWYFRSVNAGYREAEGQAIALAKQQGGLTEIDETGQYTWEESLWIVRGKDKDNQTWMLWERSNGIVKMKMSEGFAESQIRERFSAEHPAAGILRLQPGWFAGQPVWEIRYGRDGRSSQQAIAFYAFKDGSLLKTYLLPG